MSKYFETVNFWLENLLDSNGNYTIESNEKGKFIEITINVIKEDIVLISSIAKKEKKIVKIEVKEM